MPGQRFDLRGLADSAGFKNLTAAEREFLRVAPTDEEATCQPVKDCKDQTEDPLSKASWSEQRTIRAELIRWLCTEPKVKSLVDPTGVSIIGAVIVDAISLAFVTVPFPLRFLSCRIPNGIHMPNAHLIDLDLDGSSVSFVTAFGTQFERDVFLRDGFHASGELRFEEARIGGNLECDGGYFAEGLDGDGVEVSGAIFLRNIRSKGQFRLINASIGGNFECDGSVFECPQRSHPDRSNRSINANGAIVKGNVFLRRGFISDGDVSLIGTQIEGDLDCSGGSIIGQLGARGASIKGELDWTAMVHSDRTELNLRDASVYGFHDDSASWPSKGHLLIEGFVYVSETQHGPDKKSRLEWLARLEPFSPQPYRQMAKVKQDSGDERSALEILVEMEHRQRGEQRAVNPASEMLKWTIGYGYYPLRALGAFSLLTGLSWILYRRGYLASTMTPTDNEAYQAYKVDQKLPPHYPRFSPLVYSIENSLPLVNLGQVDKWGPDPSQQALLSDNPKGLTLRETARLIKRPKSLFRVVAASTSSSAFLQKYLWIQIILGWILASLFAAGVAGMIRKS